MEIIRTVYNTRTKTPSRILIFVPIILVFLYWPLKSFSSTMTRTAALNALGLDESVGDSDIKMAYRRLSMKYHPDRWVNANEQTKLSNEEKFKKVFEAYRLLNSSQKGEQESELTFHDFCERYDFTMIQVFGGPRLIAYLKLYDYAEALKHEINRNNLEGIQSYFNSYDEFKFKIFVTELFNTKNTQLLPHFFPLMLTRALNEKTNGGSKPIEILIAAFDGENKIAHPNEYLHFLKALPGHFYQFAFLPIHLSTDDILAFESFFTNEVKTGNVALANALITQMIKRTKSEEESEFLIKIISQARGFESDMYFLIFLIQRRDFPAPLHNIIWGLLFKKINPNLINESQVQMLKYWFTPEELVEIYKRLFAKRNKKLSLLLRANIELCRTTLLIQ